MLQERAVLNQKTGTTALPKIGLVNKPTRPIAAIDDPADIATS